MYILEIVVAAASIVIWSVMLALSFSISYPASSDFWAGGGAFPFIVTLLLILLNVVWIVDTICSVKTGKQSGDEETQKKSLVTFLFGPKEQSRRLFIIMLLTVCYIFALIPIAAIISRTYGFAIATFIFLIISIKLFGKTSWLKAILISGITAGLIFAIMNNVLRLPMPK